MEIIINNEAIYEAMCGCDDDCTGNCPQVGDDGTCYDD